MPVVVTQSPKVQKWVAAIVVMLICVIGIAVSLGSTANPRGSAAVDIAGPAPAPTPPLPATAKVAKPGALAATKFVKAVRCVDCGVIASTAVVDTPAETELPEPIVGPAGNGIPVPPGGGLAEDTGAVSLIAVRRYETTVRFNDGSTRVFADAALPHWRIGDRIKVIDGAIRRQG